MSSESRDHAIHLAKQRSPKALAAARKVVDPWYRAQALSYVARFTSGDPAPVLDEAFAAAAACEDAYQRVAVSAWPIRALIELGRRADARARTTSAASELHSVQPTSSRSQAAFLLFQAAFPLGAQVRERLAHELLRVATGHWRAARNFRDGVQMLARSDRALAERLVASAPDPALRAKAARALSEPAAPRTFFH